MTKAEGASSLIRLFDPGACIFSEGEPGDCAFLIEEGVVDISIKRDGGDVTLAQRGAGDIIGEMAIIDGRPRSASAVAVSPCHMIRITRDQLQNRIDHLDPVLRHCFDTVLARFRETMRQVTVSQPAITANSLVGRREQSEVIQSIRTEYELARAIENNEFRLYLQPILELEQQSIAGFEALLRWQHPERGIVPPASFIPIAEASGQIRLMTQWVFEQCCIAMTSIEELGAHRELFISLNVSSIDLSDPDLCGRLADTLCRYRVNAGVFKLEITESVLMEDTERAATILQECRKMGFSVAIDDFGTGYSSFSYLHKYPADCLKIDRSFVESVCDDQRSAQIVSAMSTLADNLGIPVVAEGIETSDQARKLNELGCRFGQGFLFARPMPMQDALKLEVIDRGERRANRQITSVSSSPHSKIDTHRHLDRKRYSHV